jgi:GT2 family glycosyltransferase
VESSQRLKVESRLHPTVSIIVPTYGRPGRLGQLLATLLQQDIPSHQYEVIVVDDGSPEPAGEIVGRVAEETPVSVKCLRKSNGGPAFARAFGAERARGDLLIFVDDDMLVASDFVREHMAAHREIGPAAVNCLVDWRVEAHPKSFERWYKRRVREWGEVRQAALRRIGDGLFAMPSALLTASNLSVSRSDYQRVGGFDLGYTFPACEDQDFGIRLAAAGVRAVVTSRTRATHVETHNTLKSVCRRQAMGARETVRFMRRFSLLDGPDQEKIVMVNDPIEVGVDPWRIAMKKMLKTIIACDVASPLVWGAMALWGRVPLGLLVLQRAYDLVVGAHLRKGWCQGRRMYGAGVEAVRSKGKTSEA